MHQGSNTVENGHNCEAVECKILGYGHISHSTALRFEQLTHFNPPITSKVIHIQSLRDYFSLGILWITHYLKIQYNENNRPICHHFRRNKRAVTH